MLTIYIYSRGLYISPYIDSEIDSEIATAVKPNLIGWVMEAAAKLAANIDNTGQSDELSEDCPRRLPRA